MTRHLLLGAAMALLAGAALAQNPPMSGQGPVVAQPPVVIAPSMQGQAAMPKGQGVARQQVEAACHQDMVALCPEVISGQGRLLQCLKQHEARLSPRCRDASAQLRAVMKDGG